MELVNLSGFSPAWLVWKIRPPAWSMTVIVKGTFRLFPDATAVRDDAQLPATGNEHADEDPAKALRYENDFAPFKPKADLLLVGQCHAPGGKPIDACGITFGVGKWSKRLAVVSKNPFTRMPISYENAYGGPDRKQNPIGKEAPNVVFPDRPQDTSPAGFGPIPQTWSQRMRKTGGPGNYSKKWLKTRWPWWPEAFDWGFYNAAPEDQQWERLTGDEEMYFENLHPKHPRFHCRLPGLRARAFTREKSDFREIPMLLDTLWVDADAETLVLVWRGRQDVPSQKLEEIEHLLLASEPLTAPPVPKEEYEKKLHAAITEREKPFEPEMPQEEKPLLSAELPKEPILPPEAQAQIEAAEKRLAEAEKQGERLDAEAVERIKEAGVSWPPKPAPAPSAAELRKQFLDSLLAAKESLVEQGRPVPPKLAEVLRNPPDLSEFEMPEISKAAEPWKVEEPPAAPAPPPREDVLKRIAAQESCAGMDLSAVDLSDRNLVGGDLRGAILRDADLSRANLASADLSGAVLVGAKLEGAHARGASLVAADLSGALLRAIDLSEAKLRDALFVGADLTEAKLALADATEADFSRADLTRADLRKARLPQAMLSEARLDGADLSGANLRGAGLMRAVGKGLIAEGADLTECKASGADFGGANFKKIRADGSVWEAASLPDTGFSLAQLRRAEFSSANLERAVLVSADAREARFVEASLRKADLTRANLFRGNLEKADLTEASLVESNLYEAEAWEAVWEGADLRGANVKMSKLAMKE